MTFVPSANQERIFQYVEGRFARGQTFNLQVQAYAGAAKTTTLLEVMKRTPSTMAILYLAFGREIANETREKIAKITAETGRDCDVRTLNGMGLRVYRTRFPKAFLDDNKTHRILDEHIDTQGAPAYDRSAVCKLVSLAKAYGLVPSFCKGNLLSLTPDTPEQWAQIIDKYDIEPGEGVQMPNNVMVARRVLCIGTTWRTYLNVLDFDDMMYMPVAHRIAPRFKFDLVLVDEAQDISKVQRHIARVVGKGSRIFVGDRFQAIFAFRGADSESMDSILEEFACDVLTLDVSFRCPRAVVELAQTLVPGIQPAPGAEEGLAIVLDSYEARSFKPGDMVVCRNTAPLVSLAYGLIAHRVPVAVVGSDIGQGLIKLVNHLVKASGCSTVAEFRQALDAWEEKEAAEAEQADKPHRAASIRDKAECLRTVAQHMSGKASRIVRTIETMFTDDPSGKVMLMTIHKAKGLEAQDVWLLDEQLMPSSWATRPHQIQQETNLHYVAITRAKKAIRRIRSGGLVPVAAAA